MEAWLYDNNGKRIEALPLTWPDDAHQFSFSGNVDAMACGIALRNGGPYGKVQEFPFLAVNLDRHGWSLTVTLPRLELELLPLSPRLV